MFRSLPLSAQASAGNEKFNQKQYAEAANAYEQIPAAQRDAGIYNRIGVSYHLSNQLRAAENAYKGAIRLESDNADAPNNLAALYYSQRKFSDAERQVRRALEKSPDNAILRFNLRAARYARENTKNARDAATSLAKSNPLLIEKREGDLLQMQTRCRPKTSRKRRSMNGAAILFCPQTI